MDPQGLVKPGPAVSRAPAPRVVAVLGMHRSGTSWLAGSLEEKGLALGEVSRGDPHNRKGNRESPVLMEIHEGVLRDNGGSWKRPPARVQWSPERSARLAEHVRAMNARHAVWGFKDPRTLLLLDEWHRQIPQGLVCVGIYRHPLAVHRSLASRSDRFDEKRSLELWRHYNERLVAEHRRSPFPLLRFDVDRSRLAASLQAVAAWLELPGTARSPQAAGGNPFYDPELVHARDEGPVPRRCRDLWDRLESHTLRT